MKGTICKYKNDAKCAFTFTFDDGCYGESTSWVYEIFKGVYEKTGVKLKATSAQTVNFISPNMKALWDKLFLEGYFDLCAHSMDHCLCYNESTEAEKLHRDAEDSRLHLEKMYPEMRALTYATPGGGSNSFGWDILKRYYIANRNGNDRMNIPTEIDWYDIGTFTAMLKRDSSEYIEEINRAIACGGWCVQINHWITKLQEDKFHAQRYDTFVDQCEYLAKVSLSGDCWVATLNEAVLYLQEAEVSQLKIQEENGRWILTVDCPLDGEIYNYPLTVRISHQGKERLLDLLPNVPTEIQL